MGEGGGDVTSSALFFHGGHKHKKMGYSVCTCLGIFSSIILVPHLSGQEVAARRGAIKKFACRAVKVN